MPKGVYANFAHITKREVEDSAFVLYDFDNGAHASIDVGFATKGAPPMEIEINGTEGTVFFRSNTGPNGKGAPDGATFEKRIGDDKVFSPVAVGTPSPIPVALWSKHILAKTRPDANIDMAIKLSILNEASYQSAATGRHVDIASVKG
jgi:predicted dehydrogenase